MNQNTPQLQDYFEFLSPDDIRLKGHRIGIDDVLEYYLQGLTTEQILHELPSLNLEKIQATIAYYHQNQAEIDNYLSRLAQWREQQYQEWLADPSPVVRRLRVLKAQRNSQQTTFV